MAIFLDKAKIEENKLFNARPGITDFSSIIFSDEGSILSGSINPDLMYNQLIRPWKSRLGLFYVKNQSFWIDISLIFLTLVSVISRPIALKGVKYILSKLKADDKLVEVADRKLTLQPYPPPGASNIELRY